MSLPGLSGLEIYGEMLKLNPGVKVLLSSGFAEDERVKKAREQGVRGFIHKPYTAEDLAREIKKVVEE